MLPANIKDKSYEFQNDVFCLPHKTKDIAEKTQESAQPSFRLTKQTQKISSGVDSTSELTEQAIKKLDERLRGIGLFQDKGGYEQDSAFTKTLYTLQLSLLETQNANMLLQRKLTDMDKEKGADGIIQERNDLELENLNLVSMFTLVEARLSEVHERFCGSGPANKKVKSISEDLESPEMLKVNLMVIQQIVNELQEKLKTLTAELKNFKDGEDNYQFLTVTTKNLHAQIEDLKIQIKELTSCNSVYERELQAANQAITGYRNTSTAKRLKGINEKQRLEYEITLEKQVKEKDSENKATESHINKLTLKYKEMEIKMNTVQPIESADTLQLSRLELQIEIGKIDFESEARRKKIEEMEHTNDIAQKELEKNKKAISKAYERASNELVKVKSFYEKQRTSYEIKITTLEKHVNTKETELQELKVVIEQNKQKFEQDIVAKEKIINEEKQSLSEKVEYIGKSKKTLFMAIEKIIDLQSLAKQSTDSINVLHKQITKYKTQNQIQLQKINQLKQSSLEEKSQHEIEIKTLRQELSKKNMKIASLKDDNKQKIEVIHFLCDQQHHNNQTNCLKKIEEKKEAHKHNYTECKMKVTIMKTNTLEIQKVTKQPIQTNETFRCFQLTRHQTTTKVICERKPSMCINPKIITCDVSKFNAVTGSQKPNKIFVKPKFRSIITIEKISNPTTPIGITKLTEFASQRNYAIARPNENQFVDESNVIADKTAGKDYKIPSAITTNDITKAFPSQDNATTTCAEKQKIMADIACPKNAITHKGSGKTPTGNIQTRESDVLNSPLKTSSTSTSSDEILREKKRRIHQKANKKAKRAATQNKADGSNNKEPSSKIITPSSTYGRPSSSSSSEEMSPKKRYRRQRRTKKKVTTNENIFKVDKPRNKGPATANVQLDNQNTNDKKETRHRLKRGIKLPSCSSELSVSEMLRKIDYPDRPMNSASFLTKEDVDDLLSITSKEISIKKKSAKLRRHLTKVNAKMNNGGSKNTVFTKGNHNKQEENGLTGDDKKIINNDDDSMISHADRNQEI